jgi:hypothetical protein
MADKKNGRRLRLPPWGVVLRIFLSYQLQKSHGKDREVCEKQETSDHSHERRYYLPRNTFYALSGYGGGHEQVDPVRR